MRKVRRDTARVVPAATNLNSPGGLPARKPSTILACSAAVACQEPQTSHTTVNFAKGLGGTVTGSCPLLALREQLSLIPPHTR